MINVHKRSLYFVFTVYFVLFSCGINFSFADTGVNNTSVNGTGAISQNVYNYAELNLSTKTFVNRLNQLPQYFTFNGNLKRTQAVLPDVKYLKWVLNSDPRTALTDNPNMTLEELNSSFGPITEAAVKKFQTLYRSEILDPQGIANATGIVGVATRKKINWLLSQSRALAISANNVILNNGYIYNNSNPSYINNFVYFPYNTDGGINTNNDVTQTSQNSSSSYADGTYSTSTNSTSSMLTTSNSTTILSSQSSSDTNSGAGALGILGVLGGAALLSGALNGGTSAAAGAAGSAAGSTASKAATQTVLSQFGGKVTMNMICPCSSNYMITVYDLSLKIPLSVIFQPGVSTLKMNYNPTIGETVLGGYVRGPAQCMVYVAVGCSPYGAPAGVIDTLRGIGTTLSPAGK